MAEQAKAKEPKILNVQFIESINIGGDVRSSVQPEKHKKECEKTATGLWIRGAGHPDRWVPDSQIKWIEFSK